MDIVINQIEWDGDYYSEVEVEAFNDELIIIHDIEASRKGYTTGDNIYEPKEYTEIYRDINISNIEVLDRDYESVSVSQEQLKEFENLLIKKYKL